MAAGYPMVDIRVTLFDGKAHTSTPPTWPSRRPAGWRCEDAAATAEVALLEPVDEVSVLVPDDFVGAVMSDLSVAARPGARHRAGRGRPHPGEGRGPRVELTRYAIDLRSMSHGTGSFTRTYLRHEPMPQHQADRILAGG